MAAQIDAIEISSDEEEEEGEVGDDDEDSVVDDVAGEEQSEDAERSLLDEKVRGFVKEGEGHLWCRHLALLRRWLPGFLLSREDATETDLWASIRGQAWACLECFEGYRKLRGDVLVGFSWVTSSCTSDLRDHGERLVQWDRDNIFRTFTMFLAVFARGIRSPNAEETKKVSFAVFESLQEPTLLLNDKAIYAELTAVLLKISDSMQLDEAVESTILPGMLLLLSHENAKIREWALKCARQMPQIGEQAFIDSVEPVFKAWYSTLEMDYIRQLPGDEAKDKGLELGKKQCWVGMKHVLKNLETDKDSDGLSTVLIDRFPSLPCLLLSQIAAHNKQTLFYQSPDMRRIMYETVGLVLLRFKHYAWALSNYTPEDVLDGISSILCHGDTRGGGVDPTIQPCLALLPAVLKSVRRVNASPAATSDSSVKPTPLTDRAVTICINASQVTRIDSPRHQAIENACAEVIQLIYEDRSHAVAATWPVELAPRWGALLLTRLKQSTGLEDPCCAALVLSLEAHSIYAKELYMDQLPGGAQPTRKQQLDVLCHRLYSVLVRHPPHKLPVVLRHAIFRSQAHLCLLTTKENVFLSASLIPLVRSCHQRSTAFASFLQRLLGGPDNPFATADAAAAVAATVIPCLMIDDTDVARALQQLMANEPQGSHYVITLPEALVRLPEIPRLELWKGVEVVLRDMGSAGYHGVYQTWNRFCTLVLTLLEATVVHHFKLQALSGVWPFWRRFLQAVLREGRRHKGSPSFLATSTAFLATNSAMAPFIPYGDLRNNAWLGLLIDWAEDEDLQGFPQIRIEAIKIVLAVIDAIITRSMALQGPLWKRLLSLGANAAVPREIRHLVRTFTDAKPSIILEDVEDNARKEKSGGKAGGIGSVKERPKTPSQVEASAQVANASTKTTDGGFTLTRAGSSSSSSSSNNKARSQGFHVPGPLPIGRVAGTDDVEMFQSIKALTAQSHVRDFHRHVLRWKLHDILGGSDARREKDEALKYLDVPVRFRDAVHYIEVWEPLLLEETRCSIGKDLEERSAQTTAPRWEEGGGLQHRGNRTVDRFLIFMQACVPDGEADGLYTCSCTMADARRQGLKNAGDDIFLLRPRGKLPAARLEEGEVSDEDINGAWGGQGTATDWQKEAAQPHLLAALVGGADAKAGGGNANLDSVRFRVWRPQGEEGATDDPLSLDERVFRKGTEWIGICLGSMTSSLREFAALREVQRIRLAGRLIQGGAEKVSSISNLRIVSTEELVKLWATLAEMAKGCEGDGKTSAGALQAAVKSIKKLKKVRVSGKLLQDSGVGRQVHSLKKSHWSADIRDACEAVLVVWKQQISTEKDCYNASAQQASSSSVPPGAVSGTSAPSSSKPSAASATSAPIEPSSIRCPSQVPAKLWHVLCSEYNGSQLSAIAAACQTNTQSFRKSGEITLLQGPPGTGKTKTILGLLSAILHLTGDRLPLSNATGKEGTSAPNIRPVVRASGGQRNNRVLVCTPSNGAVDVIVSRLRDDGLWNAEGKVFHPPIVRLGATDRSSPAHVQAATLDAQVNSRLRDSIEMQAFKSAEEEVTRLRKTLNASESGGRHGAEDASDGARQAEMERRQRRVELGRAQRRRWEALRALDTARAKARVAVIKDARIVLSTLSTSAGAHLSEAVITMGAGYGTVVIDEAGQAVEPATIIPLRYGCRNLILVGDPRQLPATVLSPTVTKHGYNLSLFERLEQGGHPVHMLTVQYRMLREIRAFPSLRFYENRLLDAPHLCVDAVVDGGAASSSSSSSSAGRHVPVIMPYHAQACFPPYLVYHIANGQEERDKKSSFFNRVEARFAVDLFCCFQAEYPVLAIYSRVAVITPYKGQVRTLRHEFQRALGPEWERKVEINTVDGFQGREKDVIIFSCVRADVRGGVGFLADHRRMNVGLTRAKRALFVLAHAEALRSDDHWEALIDNARSRSCLVDTRGKPFSEVREMLQRLKPEERAPSWVVRGRPSSAQHPRATSAPAPPSTIAKSGATTKIDPPKQGPDVSGGAAAAAAAAAADAARRPSPRPVSSAHAGSSPRGADRGAGTGEQQGPAKSSSGTIHAKGADATTGAGGGTASGSGRSEQQPRKRLLPNGGRPIGSSIPPDKRAVPSGHHQQPPEMPAPPPVIKKIPSLDKKITPRPPAPGPGYFPPRPPSPALGSSSATRARAAIPPPNDVAVARGGRTGATNPRGPSPLASSSSLSAFSKPAGPAAAVGKKRPRSTSPDKHHHQQRPRQQQQQPPQQRPYSHPQPQPQPRFIAGGLPPRPAFGSAPRTHQQQQRPPSQQPQSGGAKSTHK